MVQLSVGMDMLLTTEGQQCAPGNKWLSLSLPPTPPIPTTTAGAKGTKGKHRHVPKADQSYLEVLQLAQKHASKFSMDGKPPSLKQLVYQHTQVEGRGCPRGEHSMKANYNERHAQALRKAQYADHRGLLLTRSIWFLRSFNPSPCLPRYRRQPSS